MKKLLFAMVFLMFLTGSAQAVTYGVWQSSVSIGTGGPTEYIVFSAGLDGNVYGIVYDCARENLLPCTWSSTFVILVPGSTGTLLTGTNYAVVVHMPLSTYLFALQFTSQSSAIAVAISCATIPEVGYTPGALASGGPGYFEASQCSLRMGSYSYYTRLL